ncbi:hypothetical protein BH11PLA2_BH11PLA2_22550 [soil metagenome]
MNKHSELVTKSLSSQCVETIGIIMPVFSTEHLGKALAGVLSQSLDRWVLAIQPMSATVDAELKQWNRPEFRDRRVSVSQLCTTDEPDKYLHYAEALRRLTEVHKGLSTILIVDDCDILESHAVGAFCEAFRTMPWASAICARRQFISGDGATVEIPEWIETSGRGYSRGATIDLLNYSSPIALRISALNDCVGWDSSLPCNFVICDMLSQLEEHGEIEFLTETLLKYRLGCYSHREQPSSSRDLKIVATKMLERRGLSLTVSGQSPLLRFDARPLPKNSISDIDFVVPHYESNEIEISHLGSRVTSKNALQFQVLSEGFRQMVDDRASSATRIEFEFSTTGPVTGRFELAVTDENDKLRGQYRRDLHNEHLGHERVSLDLLPKPGSASWLSLLFLPYNDSQHRPVIPFIATDTTQQPVFFCRIFERAPGACRVQLDRCIQSLVSCGISAEQVCVVDDVGSAARNRNRGVERTNRNLVCFVDDDVVCHDPGTFERLLEAMYEEQWDIVGPKLLQPSGTIFCAKPSLTNHLTPLVHYGEEDSEALSVRTQVSWLPTTLLLTRRSVLTSIGGFDEAFPGSQMEDTDWALRATTRGFSNGYVGDVAVLHENYQRCAYHYENLHLFRKKWQRRWPRR